MASNRLAQIACCFALAVPPAPLFAEILLTPEGREIQINTDGTWSYLSQDRIVSNQAGQQIRLKPDGTWALFEKKVETIVGSGESNPASGIQATATPPVRLTEYVIETVRSTRHKNAREQSRMVVTLSLADEQAVPGKSEIRLEDSRGRAYEILSVEGDARRLRIKADESPRWWGVKYFTLTLPGNLSLRIPMTDVIERNLSEFSD